MPGADELLTYLKSHYFKTAVATASGETKAMTYLDEVGLLDYFGSDHQHGDGTSRQADAGCVSVCLQVYR